MRSIEKAVGALEDGQFVLVHDDKTRENEIDMVIAAEYIEPQHIATMRSDAGGLICLAISNEYAVKLGLVYMHEIMQNMTTMSPVYSKLIAGKSPYGDKPSFSISINHRDTYTGITDSDRALTISKMVQVCKNIDSTGIDDFTTSFRAPGHVPILIASKDLLLARIGHTELCIYLTQLGRLVNAVVICEMLDSATHKSLSLSKAEEYAANNGLQLLDASQLKTYARVS